MTLWWCRCNHSKIKLGKKLRKNLFITWTRMAPNSLWQNQKLKKKMLWNCPKTIGRLGKLDGVYWRTRVESIMRTRRDVGWHPMSMMCLKIGIKSLRIMNLNKMTKSKNRIASVAMMTILTRGSTSSDIQESMDKVTKTCRFPIHPSSHPTYQ